MLPMKRILGIVLCVAVLLTVVGCAAPSQNGGATTTSSATATTVNTAQTTETVTASTTTTAEAVATTVTTNPTATEAVVTTTVASTTVTVTPATTTTTALPTTTTTNPTTTTTAPTTTTTAGKYPATGVIKVVCVGDSITRNGYWMNGMQGLLPTDRYLVKGYGVDSTTAMSTGISGRGQEMAYTSKNSYDVSLRSNPDVVVIMFGTNDAFDFNWNQACNANGAQFKKDYIALIRAYQNLESHPEVFMVLPPTSFYAGSNCSQNLTTKVVPALREIAAETGITLVDVHTPTANAQAHFTDGLHPSDNTGRLLIATPIAAAIKKDVEDSFK